MDCSPIVLAHEEPFSIGGVLVRPATRELALDGRVTVLEPRVMQMLVALHRAGGGVVSKDDLFKQCWDGRIVGDDAINRVISRLRHDAERHADNVFRVETITKVGYRLVSEGAPGSASHPTDSAEAVGPLAARRQLVIGGAAAAVAVGAGAIGWSAFIGSPLSGEAKTLVEESRSAMLVPTPEGISNSVARLRTASQLAPDSAEVWGLLALAYQVQLGGSPGNQREAIRSRSLEAARRALAIDGSNGDALAALVAAEAGFGEWWAIEQATRRALGRAPRNQVLNRILATLLLSVGRDREALIYLDHSLRAEPMAVYTHMWRTIALWDLGRLDEAEAAIENAYRLWPRHNAIWFIRNYFLSYNGRAHEALAMVADFASRPVGVPDWNFDAVSLQCQALATRDRVAIDQAMAAWVAAAKRGAGLAQVAIIFAGAVGRLDAAFEIIDGYYFDRGFTLGEHRYAKEQAIYTVKDDRNTYFLFLRPLAPLRRDPRFKRLTSELGLDDYWARSGVRPNYLG